MMRCTASDRLAMTLTLTEDGERAIWRGRSISSRRAAPLAASSFPRASYFSKRCLQIWLV